jgi:hypothetical protein
MIYENPDPGYELKNEGREMSKYLLPGKFNFRIQQPADV